MSDLSTWIEKNRDLWKRVYDEVIAPDFEEEWRKSAIFRMHLGEDTLTIDQEMNRTRKTLSRVRRSRNSLDTV
jgi:hypothetical protein